MRRLLAWLGLLAFVAGARAETFVFVSLAKEKRIATYRMDEATGALKLIAQSPCEGEPAALVASPDHKILYASLRPEGKLSSFRIDAGTGALRPLNTVDAGVDPAHLSMDRQGRHLLSAYYVAAKAAVHPIERDGSISKQPTSVFKTMERAHAIQLDQTQRFAYVPHTGPNAIFVFKYEAALGKLTPIVNGKIDTPANTGPRHMVMHPRQPVVYVDNEQGGSVTAYRVNSTTGNLSPFQTLSTLPAGFGGQNACAEIRLHPSGRLLFVSNRGHDSIATFRVNDLDGRLEALGQTPTEKTPRSFDIDPLGRFLYVAGEGNNRLTGYRIDLATGTLKRANTQSTGEMPWWVLCVRAPAR